MALFVVIVQITAKYLKTKHMQYSTRLEKLLHFTLNPETNNNIEICASNSFTNRCVIIPHEGRVFKKGERFYNKNPSSSLFLYSSTKYSE